MVQSTRVVDPEDGNERAVLYGRGNDPGRVRPVQKNGMGYGFAKGGVPGSLDNYLTGVPDREAQPGGKMSASFESMRPVLIAGAIAGFLSACSKDGPTTVSDRSAAGNPQADLSILAAPANDDFDDATVITALPFTDRLSTADATIANDDPLGDDLCGFGTIDGHTVWYQFTPTQNMRINANTSGTRGFDHNIFVYTGTRGNLTRVSCNFLPVSATFDALAGVTYYLLLGSQGDAPGGDLVFTVQRSLDVAVTIDHVGEMNRLTGTVPVSGTVTCSRSAFVEGGVSVERQGNLFTGFVDFPFSDCDGVTPWEVEVVTFESRVLPGPAHFRAAGLFTDNSSTEEVHAEASTRVILKPGR
jgi:hypothetical protein